MKRIGMIVAVEIRSVFSRYQDQLERLEVRGHRVYRLRHHGAEIYIAHSGAGQIKAAAAVQMLIDRFDVEWIVNFGVVGSLREELDVAHTCFVKHVVHYEMDTSAVDHIPVGRHVEYPDVFLPTSRELLDVVSAHFPDIPLVNCASGDKFVASPETKRELQERFQCDICDMESAAVVLVCDLHGIPNLLIKTVSDSITGGAQEFLQRVNDTADLCLQIVDQLLREMVG
ncbi:MAG: 5'-methylthioadenosine/S-adenosylhomocysteine nucleosidase [Bacillota bacterium]|nr:5'-methylthioadenosine/S-adenosylhomocysteine nucleosidase [Bacillota bacterium]